MMVGILPSFWECNFLGAMLNLQGVDLSGFPIFWSHFMADQSHMKSCGVLKWFAAFRFISGVETQNTGCRYAVGLHPWLCWMDSAERTNRWLVVCVSRRPRDMFGRKRTERVEEYPNGDSYVPFFAVWELRGGSWGIVLHEELVNLWDDWTPFSKSAS